MENLIIWGLYGICLLVVLQAYIRAKRPLITVFSSVLLGGCGLGAVWLSSSLTGITLGLNLYTILTGAILGLPGVITLLGVRLIL